MVDVFAGLVGVSSSAVWVEIFRHEIEEALREEFGSADAVEIVWRRSDGRLQQDGWKGDGTKIEGFVAEPVAVQRGDEGLEEVADIGETEEEEKQARSETVGGVEGRAGGGEKERPEGGSLWDTLPATIVRELGLEYEVHPQFGQKTGESEQRPTFFFTVCLALGSFCWFSPGNDINIAAVNIWSYHVAFSFRHTCRTVNSFAPRETTKKS